MPFVSFYSLKFVVIRSGMLNKYLLLYSILSSALCFLRTLKRVSSFWDWPLPFSGTLELNEVCAVNVAFTVLGLLSPEAIKKYFTGRFLLQLSPRHWHAVFLWTDMRNHQCAIRGFPCKVIFIHIIGPWATLLTFSSAFPLVPLGLGSQWDQTNSRVDYDHNAIL